MSVTDEIILRMTEACDMKNTAQMLRFIEVSSGAAGLWKKREKVPDGSLAKVSERSGVSLHWLKTGEGEMYGRRYEPIVGQRFELFRKKTGISQAAFSAELKISREHLLEIESGEKQPDTEIISEFIRCFPIDVNWLLTGKGEMTIPTHETAPQPQTSDRNVQSAPPLDRELMKEAIITINMAEERLNIKLNPEKHADLCMMIYDEYNEGNEIESEKVLRLVQLAA